MKELVSLKGGIALCWMLAAIGYKTNSPDMAEAFMAISLALIFVCFVFEGAKWASNK